MANVVGGDTYEEPGRANEGARCGCIWCCIGELSGEALAKEDRSDEPDVTDWRCNGQNMNNIKSGSHTSSQVNKFGQNSRSSSKSKDRPASNRARNAVNAGGSTMTGFSTCFVC